MSNLTQRLLLFFVGVPAIIAIVVFLPQGRHAAVVALLLLFSGGSGVELGRLFVDKGIAVKPAVFGAIAAVGPGLFYAALFIKRGSLAAAGIGSFVAAILAVIVLSAFAFSPKEKIPDILPRATGYGFAFIYPGLLAGFLVLIAAQPPRATEAIITFACMTFGNDSLAWLAGTTLGKRRGLIAVSPNKSLEGFFGGVAGSLAGGLAAYFAFPASFPIPVWALLLMAVAVALATVLGDLFESGLKRSAGAKDSGGVVPGRGGFLDSFDSLLFAAPVFFGLAVLLRLFR
ncbi:MAG: phosphatidate cytidylyltransferase [Spirochaetaceae bacterium]|nr:phosphatidate cytidylyltransferase [Spirochaetaceae bacterium]